MIWQQEVKISYGIPPYLIGCTFPSAVILIYSLYYYIQSTARYGLGIPWYRGGRSKRVSFPHNYYKLFLIESSLRDSFYSYHIVYTRNSYYRNLQFDIDCRTRIFSVLVVFGLVWDYLEELRAFVDLNGLEDSYRSRKHQWMTAICLQTACNNISFLFMANGFCLFNVNIRIFNNWDKTDLLEIYR